MVDICELQQIWLFGVALRCGLFVASGMAAKSDSRSVGPLLKPSVAHDNVGCLSVSSVAAVLPNSILIS